MIFPIGAIGSSLDSPSGALAHPLFRGCLLCLEPLHENLRCSAAARRATHLAIGTCRQDRRHLPTGAKVREGRQPRGIARLQRIATALYVPAMFFYSDEGLGKRASDGRREVESLLFVSSAFRLRRLRAYASAKNQKVQREFVSLIASIVASE
jgi:hypothetical protein